MPEKKYDPSKTLGEKSKWYDPSTWDLPQAYTRNYKVPIYFDDLGSTEAGKIEGTYHPGTLQDRLRDSQPFRTYPNIALSQDFRDPTKTAQRPIQDTIGHELVHKLTNRDPSDRMINRSYFEDAIRGGSKPPLSPEGTAAGASEVLKMIPPGERIPSSLFGGYVNPTTGAGTRPEYYQELMRRSALDYLRRSGPKSVGVFRNLLQQHGYDPKTGAYTSTPIE